MTTHPYVLSCKRIRSAGVSACVCAWPDMWLSFPSPPMFLFVCPVKNLVSNTPCYLFSRLSLFRLFCESVSLGP